MSAIEWTEEELEARANGMRAKPIAIDKSFEEAALRVACKHGVTVAQMLGPKRFGHLVRARAELYRVLRAPPFSWSYPAIGHACGGRDHTTILAAVRDS